MLKHPIYIYILNCYLIPCFIHLNAVCKTWIGLNTCMLMFICMHLHEYICVHIINMHMNRVRLIEGRGESVPWDWAWIFWIPCRLFSPTLLSFILCWDSGSYIYITTNLYHAEMNHMHKTVWGLAWPIYTVRCMDSMIYKYRLAVLGRIYGQHL